MRAGQNYPLQGSAGHRYNQAGSRGDLHPAAISSGIGGEVGGPKHRPGRPGGALKNSFKGEMDK